MKKSVVILLAVIIVVFFCSLAYGADRYEYVGFNADGDNYYIDTQSIAYTNNQDIIRFWTRIVVSEQSRRIRISNEKNKELKRILQQFVELKECLEINFGQNTFRVVESIYIDKNRRVLHSIGTWADWGNIPPDSIIETIRNIVYRIIQNNTYRVPQQPFITPQPQPRQRLPQQRIPQPQLPLNNQQQREEYGKLLEYISWLIAQPDYPEFDRWVAQKMIQAGVTPTQVNAGIEEYVRLSGGKYSDIRAMLASWYREFYMDKYGKH